MMGWKLDDIKKTGGLVAVGFLSGAAVTYAMAGLESGSRADWVAAAGTWVIGIAACALTFLQVRSALTARYSDEVRQLRVISVRAASLCVVASRFDDLDKSHAIMASSPRTLIGALEQRCASMNFDLALIDTDDEFEIAVSNFDYNVTAVQSICRSLLNISGGRESEPIGETSEYSWLLGQIGRLTSSQGKLQDEIKRKISEIGKRGGVTVR
ncbi:TPA: hypothetical protein ACJ509_000126 [Stenotrophomonas maltophilia]